MARDVWEPCPEPERWQTLRLTTTCRFTKSETTEFFGPEPTYKMFVGPGEPPQWFRQTWEACESPLYPMEPVLTQRRGDEVIQYFPGGPEYRRQTVKGRGDTSVQWFKLFRVEDDVDDADVCALGSEDDA